MRIPKQSTEVAWRNIQGQTVILQLGQNRLFHELDETASLIWNLTNGVRTLEEIVEMIIDQFEVHDENVKQDVETFLDQLNHQGLVEWIETK